MALCRRRSPSDPAVADDAFLELTTDGPIFLAGGLPWRYKGTSAFRLPHLFAEGKDIDPFLDAYAGYNVLRSWLFAVPEASNNQPWDLSDRFDILRFYLAHCQQRGFRNELTLLTSYPRNDPSADVQRVVDRAFDELADFASCLFIELVNEPDIHLKPDTSRLVVPRTDILWTSGDYVHMEKARGRYGVIHTPRDEDWPEGGHQLMEAYHGGGPNDPSDPPHKFPWVADEPIRTDQAHGNTVQDFLAYYGSCALFGAGATIHTETGKFGLVPTDAEQPLIAAALRGLNAFPADAPRGPYRRIAGEDDPTHRTYIIGNHMVRIRPRSIVAPEPGWQHLDDDGILFSR